MVLTMGYTSSFDYGDDGKVHGVQFVIKVNDRFLPIKLPARVEKAQAVLLKSCSNFVIKPIRPNKIRGCRVKIATKPENTGLHKGILILQGV